MRDTYFTIKGFVTMEFYVFICKYQMEYKVELEYKKRHIVSYTEIHYYINIAKQQNLSTIYRICHPLGILDHKKNIFANNIR